MFYNIIWRDAVRMGASNTHHTITISSLQWTLDTTNAFVPWQMACCIQGFVVKDAISLEFVRAVPIAKVHCILIVGVSLYPWFTVLLFNCVYFYNSTASTWTLATPRTTWESINYTSCISLCFPSTCPTAPSWREHTPQCCFFPAALSLSYAESYCSWSVKFFFFSLDTLILKMYLW